MQRYSIFSLVRHAWSSHRNWRSLWRFPEPKKSYDAVIVGGGSHGLATAYYLATNHGMKNIAVLEKGWLGGGNTGRNTAILRSNYLLEVNSHFYDFSLRLYEKLSQELNYNTMLSQRGVLNLIHTDAQFDAYARRGNAMRLNGVDARVLSRDEVARLVPALDVSDQARFPVLGGLLQPRGGNIRHDAVAWGYARAADDLGVDIIQNCEVTGILRDKGRVLGVNTSRGRILAERVGLAVAGHSSQVASLAQLSLPIESHLLQAMVTEPVKPFLDTVVTFGAGHFHANQSDKGELVIGGDIDGYNSYSQKGNLPVATGVAKACLQLFPRVGRLRIMRTWGGIVDMSMDGSPIISSTEVDGLYFNGGWCYGGFKACPASGWTFAHLIANDRSHELAKDYTLERFTSGRLLNESGGGPYPWVH